MIPYSFVIFRGSGPPSPPPPPLDQLSNSQRDDCRVKQGAKYCITKQGPKSHKKHKQWDRHIKQWINNNRTTALERIAAETTQRALTRIIPCDPIWLIHMFVSSRWLYNWFCEPHPNHVLTALTVTQPFHQNWLIFENTMSPLLPFLLLF